MAVGNFDSVTIPVTPSTSVGLEITVNSSGTKEALIVNNSGGSPTAVIDHAGNLTAQTFVGDASPASVKATGSTTARTLAARAADVFNVKDYGAVGDGTTDDTASIQAAITAASAGSTVFFPLGLTFKITNTLSVTKALTLTGLGATIRQFGTGKGGVAIGASNVLVYGFTFVGRQDTTLTGGENAISAVAASPGSPLTGISIRDCTISTWGRDAVGLQYCNGSDVSGNTIDSICHAGVSMLSCVGGTIARNRISNLLGGTADIYGIILSRDATQPLLSDHPTSDVTVVGNTVTDVMTWEGIDTHGGQRITIAANMVRRCKIGVAVGPCPGAGSDLAQAPLDVTVTGNVIDSGVTDGSADEGITFTGAGGSVGTPVAEATGSITGNTVRGYGQTEKSNSGAIYMHDTRALVVADNTIISPTPVGINIYHDNQGFSVVGNTIVDPWTNSTTVGFATAINVTSDYNTGTISENTSSSTQIPLPVYPPTYWLTHHLRVADQAHTSLVNVPGYTDAATPIYDPGSHIIPRIYYGPRRTTYGTAAPGSGTWVRGDLCWNSSVASGVPEGWRCISSGTPGTWTAMSNHP